MFELGLAEVFGRGRKVRHASSPNITGTVRTGDRQPSARERQVKDGQAPARLTQQKTSSNTSPPGNSSLLPASIKSAYSRAAPRPVQSTAHGQNDAAGRGLKRTTGRPRARNVRASRRTTLKVARPLYQPQRKGEREGGRSRGTHASSHEPPSRA